MNIPARLKVSEVGSDVLVEMLESITAGVFFWDSVDDTVQWSPRLLRTLGFSESPGATLDNAFDFIHPDDQAAHRETILKSQTGAGQFAEKIRLVHADGSYRPFLSRGFWIRGEDDEADSLLGFLTEQTEVQQLSDKASRAEAIFQSFFENAPAAVYIKDQQLRHLYGNEFAARVAGCSLDDFLTKTMPELFDEETVRNLAEADTRVLDHDEVVTWHGSIKTHSGDELYIFDTKFPVKDPTTGEMMVGGFGIDTTRQHQMEVALAESQKFEALGQLVSGIAHDFNNSLAVLQGHLDLIALSGPHDKLVTNLDAMQKSVARSQRLTQHLLAYARKAVLRSESVDLNAVIPDIRALLSSALPATISLEVELEDNLFPIRADRAEFENALLNLAINARDAMPDGGTLTIRAFGLTKDEAGLPESSADDSGCCFVMVSVTDTGHGMPSETVAKAFDPFFTTKRPGAGTGMGLAMVFGLLEQLGGTARIRSAVGEGTTVEMVFPVATEETSERQREMIDLASTQGSEHVLLTEDDSELRETLTSQLESLGYTVSVARNGKEALEIVAKDDSISLLVSDIVMPEMSGPELIEKARQVKSGLKAVLISGYPMEAAIHGLDVPDDIEILSKPFRLFDLARHLRELLDA